MNEQEPLSYEFAGPPLSQEMLAALEQQLGCSLPADYRQFLLVTNGGVPSRKRFTLGPDFGEDEWWVDYFLSIDDNLTHSVADPPPRMLASLASFNYALKAIMPPEAMMIGSVCRDGVLLLYLRGPHRGEVHMVDPYVSGDPTAEDIEKTRGFVAPSFGEFLRSLRSAEV